MKESKLKGEGELGKTSMFLEAGHELGGPLDKFKILIWREFKLPLVLLLLLLLFLDSGKIDYFHFFCHHEQ